MRSPPKTSHSLPNGPRASHAGSTLWCQATDSRPVRPPVGPQAPGKSGRSQGMPASTASNAKVKNRLARE